VEALQGSSTVSEVDPTMQEVVVGDRGSQQGKQDLESIPTNPRPFQNQDWFSHGRDLG